MNTILPGKLDEAHSTKIGEPGTKYVVNLDDGVIVGLFEYDTGETGITKVVGSPVGLKQGSETIVTADQSDAIPGLAGVLLAVPSVTDKYIFVLLKGSTNDPSLPSGLAGVESASAFAANVPVVFSADKTVVAKSAATEVELGVSLAANAGSGAFAHVQVNSPLAA